MTKDESIDSRLPRRDLIRLAGLGGLTVAAASVAGGIPLPALAASAQDETPEGFLAYAYAQRAQAMTTGNTSLLNALYDPANAALLSFEKSRARFFFSGLGSRWNGLVLGYAASVFPSGLSVSGSEATARFYEGIRVTWIQAPEVVPSWLAKLRQEKPGKYATFLPRGPRGEITTGVGIRHDVVLTKGSSGWRIANDGYDERYILFGASPDLLAGSWAETQLGGTKGTSPVAVPRTTAAPADRTTGPLSQCSYDYTAAVSYAQNHVPPSHGSYNGSYCDYTNCNGDCANFVSQCFSAGGERQDSNWRTVNGGCGLCTTSSANAGTDTWANNYYLQQWVVTNNYRGQSEPGIINLGIGDIVNYNFTGSWDHVTIVTQPGSNATICSHDANIWNGPWTMNGQSNGYLWTQVYSLYNC